MINEEELKTIEKQYVKDIKGVAGGIGRSCDDPFDWGELERNIGKIKAIIDRRTKLRLEFEKDH